MEGKVMKALDFRTWLAQLTTLNRGQKDRLRTELDRRANADEVIRLIEQGLQEKPLALRPYATAALGHQLRPATLPLPPMSSHLQCLDAHTAGAPAPQGPLAHVHPGPD